MNGRRMNFGAFMTGLGLLATVLVVASGPPTTNYPCDDDVAKCPDINDESRGQGSNDWGGCNGTNAWDFSDPPQVYDFYSCNAKSPDCGDPGSGECNIMAKASGYGRTLTCEPIGTPKVSCMTQIDYVVALNIRCDNGQKCNDNGPNHTIPTLLPEASDTDQLPVPTPAPVTWPD